VTQQSTGRRRPRHPDLRFRRRTRRGSSRRGTRTPDPLLSLDVGRIFDLRVPDLRASRGSRKAFPLVAILGVLLHRLVAQPSQTVTFDGKRHPTEGVGGSLGLTARMGWVGGHVGAYRPCGAFTAAGFEARIHSRNIPTGDGFLATFNRPAAAVRCALAVGEAVRPLGLDVRAGVHTGRAGDR